MLVVTNNTRGMPIVIGHAAAPPKGDTHRNFRFYKARTDLPVAPVKLDVETFGKVEYRDIEVRAVTTEDNTIERCWHVNNVHDAEFLPKFRRIR